jgi:hypothetical protein
MVSDLQEGTQSNHHHHQGREHPSSDSGPIAPSIGCADLGVPTADHASGAKRMYDIEQDQHRRDRNGCLQEFAHEDDHGYRGGG